MPHNAGLRAGGGDGMRNFWSERAQAVAAPVDGAEAAAVHGKPGQSHLLPLPSLLCRVPTIDGRAEVKVKPGTQPGDKLRMRGYGVPMEVMGQRSRRGDQYVIIRVRVPRSLTTDQRRLLEDFKAGRYHSSSSGGGGSGNGSSGSGRAGRGGSGRSGNGGSGSSGPSAGGSAGGSAGSSAGGSDGGPTGGSSWGGASGSGASGPQAGGSGSAGAGTGGSGSGSGSGSSPKGSEGPAATSGGSRDSKDGGSAGSEEKQGWRRWTDWFK